MLPADHPFELKTWQHRSQRPRFSHVIGFAASLIVHAALLLRLLASPSAFVSASVTRSESTSAAAIQVYLLEATPPIATPTEKPSALIAVERLPAVRAAVSKASSSASRPAAPIAEDAPVSSAQLFGGIEGVARDLTASDRPFTGSGPDTSRAQLPGRAEAFVHLPLHHKEAVTPQQIGLYIGKLVVATMIAHPDDFQSATRMLSPLQDRTDNHLHELIDPVCNDPENPLRDERCWK